MASTLVNLKEGVATVLVVGGTGNVGAACTQCLADAGVSVRVLTRNAHSDKARQLAGPFPYLPQIALRASGFAPHPSTRVPR